MPIYAYRCTSCGHAQDVLQKISDPVLTVCPACGASAYAKQVTAAGFQLKGSGWYATDFRGGNAAKPDAAKSDKPAEATKPADGGSASSAPSDAPAPAPAAPTPPAPAGS
jgi:putative FmdB family regulatory protein